MKRKIIIELTEPQFEDAIDAISFYIINGPWKWRNMIYFLKLYKCFWKAKKEQELKKQNKEKIL